MSLLSLCDQYNVLNRSIIIIIYIFLNLTDMLPENCTIYDTGLI